MFGAGATFRPGQREAIEAVVRGERALVVQATGCGKSLVYWLATRVLRDRGAGPTLVVSPLLSLMRNQIAAADRLGLRAFTINSSNRETWAAARAALDAGDVDVLLISPERLRNEEFATQILPAIHGGIGLFVVDEAHCISDWGHDFRPDYRRLRRLIANLPPRTPLLATTATANNRVVADVAEQLGGDVTVIRGPLARSSLRLQAVHLRDGADRLAWLAEHLPSMPGSGIVYCLTIADTERVAAWLRSRGMAAAAYHARLPPETRIALEDDLLANRLKVLVASTALGMGFDKPDLGFVVHYQRPGSVIAYYQQVGRAGRALPEAFGVLLSGREDDEIIDWFISTAFPPEADMRGVLQALEAVAEATIPALERELNLRRMRIERALTMLEIEGAVGRDGGRYFRTVVPWEPDTERIERLTALRRAEQTEMRDYVDHEGCLMAYLTRALDDPDPAPCGRCARCVANAGEPALLPSAPASVDVVEAVRFLRRANRPIEPRLMWPAGAVAARKGRISPPNGEGRLLAVLGDAGWGRLVRDGRARDRRAPDGRFADELVVAAAELVGEGWRPTPGPAWVTCIPSVRRPALVRDFAERLAVALGLPFREVLAAADPPAPEQRTMQNSARQLANVAAAFRMAPGLPGVRVPAGAVLLVDDLVDSGWTLTYAGWLLRGAGAGPVLPFALASAAAQDGG